MSNYLSNEYKITNPVSSVDLQVVNNTLSTLQNSYNKNKAEIDQTIAYYNENLKGLRDSDNQYIAEKLKHVKSTVEEYKKRNVNLAYSYNKDSILSAVKETIKDPIVEAAILSRQNFVNYQAQVKTIKEKDSSKYSVQNELFGLEQGGYKAYMEGKTKSLGAMQYTEYIDLPAEHSKRLQEYVKNYDDEQLLSSGTAHGASPYHTVDIYGKRVLKSDLKNFLETTMDGKEKNQLMIDAWYNFKDADQNVISSYVKPKYEMSLTELQNQKAEYDAQVASGKIKEDKTITNTFNERIKGLSSKINSGSFDKNDAYNIYSQNYVDSMAEAFDKNIITKKEVDDTAFDVAKFYQEKMQWELTYDQKEREIALKNKEVGLLEQQTLGTKVEIPTESEADTDTTEFQKSMDTRNTLYKEIEEELLRTEPGFAEKSAQERVTYINSLNFSDKTRIKGGFSKELVNKVQDYNQIREAHVDTYEKTIKNFQGVAISSFQDMQSEYFKAGNDLNLDAVSAYAPTLANTIKIAKKKGKQVTWAEIPTDARYAIQAELLNAHTNKNKDSLSNDELVVNKTASYMMTSKIKDKNILNSVNKASKSIGSEVGYFENLGRIASNTADTLVKELSEPFILLKDVLTEGVDYANEQSKLRENSLKSKMLPVEVSKVDPRIFIAGKVGSKLLREEEDLDNIEARDLGGKINIGTRFRNIQEATKQATLNTYSNMSPNLKNSYAFAFSTENKAQKPTADLLKQLIMTNEEVQSGAKGLPVATNNITISPKGEGYTISYIAKGDKDNEMTSIYFAKLPLALEGMVDKTKDNWNKSIYNPALKFQDISFKEISDYDDSDNIVTNIIKYGDNIPNNSKITDLKRGIFKPTVEYIRQDVPEGVYDKFSQKIDDFLKQDFIVKTAISNQGIIQSKIYYNNINDGKRTVELVDFPQLVEKNDIAIQLDIAERIDMLKKQSLKSVK